MSPPWSALLALALTGAIGALVVVRAAWRARQACQARMLMKAERARAQADDLLQDLQGVFFQLQAARMLLPRQPVQAAQLLERALEAGDVSLACLQRHAANDRREATSLDLAARLGTAAGQLAQAALQPAGVGVSVRVRVRGPACPLPAAAHDGLLDAGRAALADALHQVPGGHVELELASGPRWLTLRVRGWRAMGAPAPRPGRDADLARVRHASTAIGARVEVRAGRRGDTEVVVTLVLANA